MYINGLRLSCICYCSNIIIVVNIFLAGTHSITVGASSVSTCLTCYAVTYSLAGQATCTTCLPGTYQPSSGAPTVCLIAPVGGFVSGYGQSNYVSCPPGTYSATAGATACTSCPPGYANPSYFASSLSSIICLLYFYYVIY